MISETSRKLASIQTISSLSPIPNSDFLELAEMKNLGWKVIVKKGEYTVGENIVFFEIDSTINTKDLIPPLDFLKSNKIYNLYTGKIPEISKVSESYVRIKTKKIRGVISQGLIVPLHPVLDCLGLDIPSDGNLTEQLKVEVWDRLVDWYTNHADLNTTNNDIPKESFPEDVPKTDETRIQVAFYDLILDPKIQDKFWEITEKNDGSSCTVFYRPNIWPNLKFGSRNKLLRENDKNWFLAFDLPNLKSRLDQLYSSGIDGILKNHDLAIQGELVGPNFNGNRDKHKKHHFRVFRIYDITDQTFVSPEIRYKICSFLGLEHVRVLNEKIQIFKILKSVDDFVDFSIGKTENGNQREGLVFKCIEDGKISFKVINPEYLIKHNE